MFEYLTAAIPLKIEPKGEYDARATCFTEKYGKITGKVTSARKITSKLVGHLQPGNLIHIRAVEKGGIQFVDALKFKKLKTNPKDLDMLASLLPDTERENELWQHLSEGALSWKEVLRILGWDPKHANCDRCSKENPEIFHARYHNFYCKNCLLRGNSNELIYI